MYQLKTNKFGHAKGTRVYLLVNTDYGSASMDSLFTQIPHISVTVDPKGNYPYITVAVHDLEEINE